MADLVLVIGNKNYSSWSMRAGVMLAQMGVDYEERRLRLDTDEWDAGIARWSPSRLVPVLWRGDVAVWDSLAIMEVLAEWFPDKGVWPKDPTARAFARCASAEMHAGFRALRENMPMNIRASHPGKGMTEAVRGEVDRIESLWREARVRFGAGGDFLFGPFTAADAMFSPVVMRLATYGVPCGHEAKRYCEAVKAAPGVRAWVEAALTETEIVAEDEPYAQPPRP
jgi:glutathione S-transferase